MLSKIKYHLLDTFKTDHVLNEFIFKYRILINELEQIIDSLNINNKKVNDFQLNKIKYTVDVFFKDIYSFVRDQRDKQMGGLNNVRYVRHLCISSMLLSMQSKCNIVISKPSAFYCLGSVKLKDGTVYSTNNSKMSNIFETYKVVLSIQKQFEKLVGKKIVIS
jgi:hypothetical protein